MNTEVGVERVGGGEKDGKKRKSSKAFFQWKDRSLAWTVDRIWDVQVTLTSEKEKKRTTMM